MDGVTEPNYKLGPNAKGSPTNIEFLDESAKYSWIKSPRWRGNAVEVGPLARYIIGYAQGKPEFKEPADNCCKRSAFRYGALLHAGPHRGARARMPMGGAQNASLPGQAPRHDQGGRFLDRQCRQMGAEDLAREAKGYGFTEAPRGALGHWIKIKNGKIDNYQCIVPTTWNGSPRDPKGNIGAFEASLMDTPMADPEKPLEILRTIHSFDPCLACSTHVMSSDGQEMASVKVR